MSEAAPAAVLPVPEQPNPEQDPQQATTVHFFYTEHSGPENAKRLAERLHDYDVVALESIIVGEYRDDAEAFANRMTHAETREEAEDLMDNQVGFFGSPFLKTLIMDLACTGKQIAVVDGDLEDLPGLEVGRKAYLEMRAAVPNQNSDEIMEKLQVFARHFAAPHRSGEDDREEIVAEQVKALIAQHPVGTRIAVFQGAAHTETYHTLKEEGVAATREFILPEHQTLPGSHIYDTSDQVMRQIMLQPEETVSQRDWQRFLMELYVDYAAAYPRRSADEREIMVQEVDKVMLQKDSTQLQALLDQIDAAREELKPTLSPVTDEKFRERILSLTQEFVANAHAEAATNTAEKQPVT